MTPPALVDVRQIVVLDWDERRHESDLVLILVRFPYHLAILVFYATRINLERFPGTWIHLLEIDLVSFLGDLDVLAHSGKFLVGPAHFEEIDEPPINFASTADHLVDLVDVIVLLAI